MNNRGLSSLTQTLLGQSVSFDSDFTSLGQQRKKCAWSLGLQASLPDTHKTSKDSISQGQTNLKSSLMTLARREFDETWNCVVHASSQRKVRRYLPCLYNQIFVIVTENSNQVFAIRVTDTWGLPVSLIVVINTGFTQFAVA